MDRHPAGRRRRPRRSVKGGDDHDDRARPPSWRAALRGTPKACAAHYLSNGRREGRYWLVGDAAQHARPLALRPALTAPTCGKGAAGKWTDAATGEHGDLLDVIRAALRPRRFPGRRRRGAGASSACPGRSNRLALTSRRSGSKPARSDRPAPPGGSSPCRSPIAGTLRRTYLAGRGIRAGRHVPRSRFHPGCYYRDERRARRAPSPR